MMLALENPVEAQGQVQAHRKHVEVGKEVVACPEVVELPYRLINHLVMTFQVAERHSLVAEKRSSVCSLARSSTTIAGTELARECSPGDMAGVDCRLGTVVALTGR